MGVLQGCSFSHVLFIVFAVKDVLVNGLSLEADLLTLSETLPGVYSNSKQHITEPEEQQLPPSRARGHMPMKIVIRPVEIPFLGHSFNVFVQKYSGTDSPYRQRLESFSVDVNQRAIRLRTFSFSNVTMSATLSQNLRLFKNLTDSDLVTQSSCDMFWRKLKKRTFVGTTGRNCVGSVRREPVRISVSTTLTPKMLTTHEGWYRLKDGTKLMEIDIPYNLLKVKKITTKIRYVPKTDDNPQIRPSRHFRRIQNDLPQSGKTRFRKRKFRKSKPKVNKPTSYLSSIPTPHSAWTLRNFRGLLDALTSGRAVYFIMELSGCVLPAQAKIERTSFGDSVDVFQHIVTNRGRRKEFITFTQRKFQQSSRGYETAVREITVFRNGKVIVRMRMMKPERVPVTYAATCQVFDYNTMSGDIKFSTDPYKNVRRIKSYGFLRSSLKKGRRVRLTADFSKCSGSSPYRLTEIGGELRGYDFINSGKGIEFSLVRPEIDLSRVGASQRALIGRVLQNGDVIFTDVTDEHTNSVEQYAQHYRCSIKDGQSNGKDGKDSSVKFYYL